jgi:hypothetical protein
MHAIYRNCFLLLFLSLQLSAQQLVQIKGKVSDAQSKEGLPTCNIFVNNTTVGTSSDLDGNFGLNYTAVGEFELVFSYVGYVAQTKKISIPKEGEILQINIELVPSDFTFSEIQVKAKRDKKWEKQLKRFQNSFFGYSDFANKCQIKNAWVIDFEENKNSFKAVANQPIQVVNAALGYELNFNLEEFEITEEVSKIKATVQFTEQEPANKAKLKEWLKNRAFAFKKSPTYFFQSLVNNKITEDGFMMFLEKPGSNSFRTDNFYAELGKSVIAYDGKGMLTPGPTPGVKKILMKNSLEVHNQGMTSQIKTYADTPYAVSWVQAQKGFLLVDNNGVPLNPNDLVVSGDMDYLKVSGMLPLNYDPSSTANEAYFLKFEKPRFTEFVHIHTDRQVYYPGEKIWMKAYLNYKNKNVKDTVSTVLYAQLVAPDQKIVSSKKLEISNAYAYSDLLLDTLLAPGAYQLRAYTNYMRNFDAQDFFYLNILILKPNEKMLSYDNSESQTDQLSPVLILAKPEHKENKTKLLLSLTDDNQKPIAANFSVAVTNPTFSAEIQKNDISKNLKSFNEIEAQKVTLKYPVEKGLTINGVYLDKNKKPIAAPVNVFIEKIENLTVTESNESGNFSLNDISFYEETTFYFQYNLKKYKDAIFLVKSDETFPPVSFKNKKMAYPIEKSSEALFEYIESKLTTETDSVKKSDQNQVKTLYGKPDYVVDSKDFGKVTGIQAIITGLRNKVPSITISAGRILIRGGSSVSLTNSVEPLVLVDGSPYGSVGASALGLLESLEPTNIDKIEVVTRISNMYGDLGKNGIISVFLKTKNKEEDVFDEKKFAKAEVMGYSRPNVFESPKIKMKNNEELPTLYWNAEVISDQTGKAEIEFDRINTNNPLKVVIQGINSRNQPFSKVLYID